MAHLPLQYPQKYCFVQFYIYIYSNIQLTCDTFQHYFAGFPTRGNQHEIRSSVPLASRLDAQSQSGGTFWDWPILGQLGGSNMCGSDQLKCQYGVDLPGLTRFENTVFQK